MNVKILNVTIINGADISACFDVGLKTTLLSHLKSGTADRFSIKDRSGKLWIILETTITNEGSYEVAALEKK